MKQAAADWAPRAPRIASELERACDRLVERAKAVGADLGELAARIRGYRRRTLQPREGDVVAWIDELSAELAKPLTPAGRRTLLRRAFARAYNLGASAPFEL